MNDETPVEPRFQDAKTVRKLDPYQNFLTYRVASRLHSKTRKRANFAAKPSG